MKRLAATAIAALAILAAVPQTLAKAEALSPFDLTASAELASTAEIASSAFCLGVSRKCLENQNLSPESRQSIDSMHARYYSHDTGRFLSVDPVGGSIGNSQSWNRYSYVQNNPLKYTDPDGEWLHIAIGAAVGGVLNAGAKAIKNSVEGKPLTEGLGKAAAVGAVAGGVTAATFGMGAAVMTGGGAAGAAATLTSTASIPTLNATGGLIVGAASSGLGGAMTGAGNEIVVEGNTDPGEVVDAAVSSGVKSAALGGVLGAAGAGPVGEAVAGEILTVVDAGYEYVAKELADSLVPDVPDEETDR